MYILGLLNMLCTLSAQLSTVGLVVLERKRGKNLVSVIMDLQIFSFFKPIVHFNMLRHWALSNDIYRFVRRTLSRVNPVYLIQGGCLCSSQKLQYTLLVNKDKKVTCIFLKTCGPPILMLNIVNNMIRIRITTSKGRSVINAHYTKGTRNRYL